MSGLSDRVAGQHAARGHTVLPMPGAAIWCETCGGLVLDAEQWRTVPPFRLLEVPAGYEASSHEQVRSVPRRLPDGRRAGGVVLKQQRDRDGYLNVRLGRKYIGVHVLVALAFHGPPEVCHLNSVRDDNRPPNVAWGSHWLNMQMTKESAYSAGEFT